jgi:hypothetical protein
MINTEQIVGKWENDMKLPLILFRPTERSQSAQGKLLQIHIHIFLSTYRKIILQPCIKMVLICSIRSKKDINPHDSCIQESLKPDVLALLHSF